MSYWRFLWSNQSWKTSFWWQNNRWKIELVTGLLIQYVLLYMYEVNFNLKTWTATFQQYLADDSVSPFEGLFSCKNKFSKFLHIDDTPHTQTISLVRLVFVWLVGLVSSVSRLHWVLISNQWIFISLIQCLHMRQSIDQATNKKQYSLARHALTICRRDGSGNCFH